MASIVGETGRIDGIDPAEEVLNIARNRCADFRNVHSKEGNASNLPFEEQTFTSVLSSRRTRNAGIETLVGCHTFRGSGITNDGQH